MENLKIFQEERPWGNFRQFTQNTSSTVKIIFIKKGEAFSLQYHNNQHGRRHSNIKRTPDKTISRSTSRLQCSQFTSTHQNI